MTRFEIISVKKSPTKFLVNKRRHPLTGALSSHHFYNICSSKLKLLLDLLRRGHVEEQSEEVSVGGAGGDSIGILPSHLKVSCSGLHFLIVAG